MFFSAYTVWHFDQWCASRMSVRFSSSYTLQIALPASVAAAADAADAVDADGIASSPWSWSI